MMMSFYADTHPMPQDLYALYPAYVHLGVMSSRMETVYVARKLITCIKKSVHVIFTHSSIYYSPFIPERLRLS